MRQKPRPTEFSKVTRIEDLPLRPRMFLVEYCRNGGDGTKAARKAGYSHPDVRASQLLRIFRKSGLLDAEFRKLHMTADHVRAAFAELAAFNGAQMFVGNTLKLSAQAVHKYGHLVTVEADSDGKVTIKAPNRMAALAHLAKMLGINGDPVDPVDTQPTVSVEFHVAGPGGQSAAPVAAKKEGA